MVLVVKYGVMSSMPNSTCTRWVKWQCRVQDQELQHIHDYPEPQPGEIKFPFAFFSAAYGIA